MQFVHSFLTWGFLLPLAPLLIHLINMMRHQRVQWAAMEFLLASYRKSRRWVWLRQFVLLALRMAAMILLVAMLARLVTDRQKLLLFGQAVTHHYVLLDDSYSMADAGAGSSAFDNAYRIIRTLVMQAAQEGGRHKLTLIRFSRAGGGERFLADFEGEPIDNRIDLLLEQRRREIEVTDLAIGPQAALDAVLRLLDQQRGETNQVYVLSDFRAREWEAPAELKSRLARIEEGGRAETSLIRCVAGEHANLGIISLAPAEDIRAAGVPLYFVVKIKNHGPKPAQKVQLRVRTLHYPTPTAAALEPGKEKTQIDELPVVLIDEIRPGETVEQRVQVYFPTTGEHTVEAILPEDAIAADNRRGCTVDFPSDLPVLILDGSPDQRESFFLTSIFQPGPRVKTGIQVTVQPASYLRDAADTDLAKFDSIYLLDVDRLESRAAARLEEFARRGGGVCFFVGGNVNFDAYNRLLYRNGEGIFPTPLEQVAELDARTDETPPDLEVTEHPVFGVFLAERSSFLQQVTIRQHARAPAGFVPPPDLGVSAPVKLRNGDPLVLERRFGKGRVVAFLTSLGPEWNDWAQNPSLVVICLRLQPHLAAARRPYLDRRVGERLRIDLDPSQYRPTVQFVAPDRLTGAVREIERTAVRPSEQDLMLAASLEGISGTREAETSTAGAYAAWLQNLRGQPEVRRFSLNVDPEEGAVRIPTVAEMSTRLSGLRARFTNFNELSGAAFVQKGVDLSVAAMILLIACLLLEQLAAYWASYHPPGKSGDSPSPTSLLGARSR